jgi:transglutaminase-like putative cysteine protease
MTSPGDVDGSTEQWHVECHLAVAVDRDATLALEITPASRPGVVVDQTLEIAVDGTPLVARPVASHHGGTIHLVRSPRGALTIDLAAEVTRSSVADGPPTDGIDIGQLVYRRQSRYCPSDELVSFASHEIGDLPPGPELLGAVRAWVADRLIYEEGSSGPFDTAVDSLFAGRGVCRDFAHLAITMLRALGVPARLVAVYAPGLTPMDFHAVVEAHVDGRWWVVDPTGLAPRSSLLRISTGRDAADTSFLTVLDGEVWLNFTEVVAYTHGELPPDDHVGPVRLA